MTGPEVIVDEAIAGQFPIDCDRIERHAARILASFNQQECEVNVVFIGDERMAILNESYRGKNGATDVLSFNLSENPDMLLEGEVYISVDRAARQAAEYDADISEELVRLVTHGLLHLCGWTHDTDEDLTGMQDETERFVKAYFNNGES